MKLSNKTFETLFTMAVPPVCDYYVLMGTVEDKSKASGKRLVIKEWIAHLN